MNEHEAPQAVPPQSGPVAAGVQTESGVAVDVGEAERILVWMGLQRAFTQLSERVVRLEEHVPKSGVEANEAKELPILVEACKALKLLRTDVVRMGNRWNEERKECGRLREENAKLLYQIKHLKRSLEAAES